MVLLAAKAHAQSFCGSDGQPVPVQLMERFINADCGNYWSDPATPQPGLRAVALDWIIPGGLGCQQDHGASRGNKGIHPGFLQ